MKYLILSIILLFAGNVDGQFYGSAALGYSSMNYSVPDYSLLTSAEVTDIRMNPILSVGAGQRLKPIGRLTLNFVSDISLLTGRANYHRTYTWMTVSEGALNFRLMRLKLNPNFNLKITKKINIDLGFLLFFNLQFHGLNGTETTFGYIDNDGKTQILPIPINHPASSVYLDTPIISTGFSATINYQISNHIALFVRHDFDKNTLNRDFIKTRTFSSGINYFFKNENQ